MSGGMREIKRRIKSVGSTRQITKAMNLVASSKLNKSKERFLQIHPFAQMSQNVISKVASGASDIRHPYITKREVKKATVIVLAGDRGLCGGYNVSVCQSALSACEDVECDYITIGGKAYEYLKARDKNIVRSIRGISENPDYDAARSIGEDVLKRFASGETDEVYLAYTMYHSTISYESTCIRLLPFDLDEFSGQEDKGLTLYEPSAEAVLSYVLPKYINTVIYGALAESALCEESARMTAMDSATENADDMLETLNTKYNRARQGAITQEITEIIGGADI
jgi:F-type H+-transporting ATPase subunit gamma